MIIITIFLFACFSPIPAAAQSFFTGNKLCLKNRWNPDNVLNKYESRNNHYLNFKKKPFPEKSAPISIEYNKMAFGKIANQLFWGFLTGSFIGATLELYNDDSLDKKFKKDEPFIAGFIIGGSFVINRMGKKNDTPGSFLKTFIGSSVGFLIGYAIDKDNAPYILSPICGTISFYIKIK